MKEYKIILTIRYSLYKPAYYFSEKVRNWDREPHQKKPTQLSGFLFIQKIFSSLLFHHYKCITIVYWLL